MVPLEPVSCVTAFLISDLSIVLQAESLPHEWERIAVRFEAAAFKLQHLCYGIN